MARMKPRVEGGTVLFDVFYEDGSRASNRKVPADVAAGPGGDAQALTFIMDQERRISALSGREPKPIKRLARSSSGRG